MAKQFTSSGGDKPIVNLGILFENDLLELGKTTTTKTKEDYFKDHEKHLAKLFKITPRASASDTRPDLYLTSSHIDSLLKEEYGNDVEISDLEKSLVGSRIALLRDRLRSFETSEAYGGLLEEFSGVEIKGSKYGIETGSDFSVTSAAYKSGRPDNQVSVGTKQTILDILKNPGLRSRLEKQFPEQKGLVPIRTELLRSTPRSLTGRSLLTAYEGNTPAKSSGVISLANAIANTFAESDPKLFALMGKDVYTKLKETQKQKENKRLGKNIYSFMLKKPTKGKGTGSSNLEEFHKAITGNIVANEMMNTLAQTPAARQVQAKGHELFMQYVTETAGKKTSFTAYLFETFKYENTKVTISPTSIDFSYTTRYEKAVVEKINDLLSRSLDSSFNDNLSNRILKESEIGQFLGTVESVANSPGKFQFKADVSGSMPIGKIKIPNYTVRRKTTGSAFTSRTQPVRSILRQTRSDMGSIGAFITDSQITALVKREMMRRMPIGPVGGPPLSSRVLTFRTGRFVDSMKVFADQRNRQIEYFYNPIYWVHEKTLRDPRNLIKSSISSVMLSLFKQKFNIVKMDSKEA